MSEAKKHFGSCHCGRVKFEATMALDTCIECNCSHCYRKGLILTFVPSEQFKLLEGADCLSQHTFNKHQIKHQFCKHCGVQSFSYGEKEGKALVAVNVRSLENIEPWSIQTLHVDGRSF